eukprot:3935939-Rhodomonas_salina.1
MKTLEWLSHTDAIWMHRHVNDIFDWAAKFLRQGDIMWEKEMGQDRFAAEIEKILDFIDEYIEHVHKHVHETGGEIIRILTQTDTAKRLPHDIQNKILHETPYWMLAKNPDGTLVHKPPVFDKGNWVAGM